MPVQEERTMVDTHRTVRVYSFRLPDPTFELASVAPYKATREAIERRFVGEVIEGTGEDVGVDELDPHGCFRRVATGWGELDH
jgi:hypothetical protein